MKENFGGADLSHFEKCPETIFDKFDQFLPHSSLWDVEGCLPPGLTF